MTATSEIRTKKTSSVWLVTVPRGRGHEEAEGLHRGNCNGITDTGNSSNNNMETIHLA
jgi:hypothetical protein